MQVQQPSEESEHPDEAGHHQEVQIDDEVMTLSIASTPTTRAEKLDLYRIREKPAFCLCFNTRCQFFLFLLITILVFAATYLVYDNRVQEGEISQILSILRKNEDGKQYPSDSTHISSENGEYSKGDMDRGDSTTFGGKYNEASNDRNVEIPKKVWYFNKVDLLQSSKWTQLTFQRVKKMVEEGGYQLFLVNEATWKTYVPRRRQNRIEALSKELSEAKQELTPKQIDRIIKQITVLEVLKENGGIFVDEDIVLTENFDWIANINSNQLVNGWQLVLSKGQNKTVPNFIGFYSPETSSEMQKYSKIQTAQEVEQYFVRLPSLNSYFMAATPYSSFMLDLLDEYYAIAANFTSLPNLLKKMHIQIDFKNNGQEGNLFQIACQFALRKKQLQLEDQIALEHYHIASLNENYGPTKLRSYLGDTQIDKIFNHLSFITMDQLEYEFGTVRYLAALMPIDKIGSQLQKSLDTQLVVKNSFVHKNVLNGEDIKGLLTLNDQILSQKLWDELPNKLWLFLQEPVSSSSFATQLWVKHLQKMANESTFELKIVTDENLHEHLAKQTITSINEAMIRNKLNIYESTKKQLISLAVLYEHGGVWVEPFGMFMENLNWLKEIAKKRFIWNRFGGTPKVVVPFHPHFGSPFHWTYDVDTGAKETWHLAYEHSLIAASPKAELINDWFNQMKTNLQTKYTEVTKRFQACKINDHKWINEKNHELLSQDSIKCVLGAKTLQLAQKGEKKSAPQYYGIWGLNGFAGLLKMREYTNFISGRSMENPLIWRYSLDEMENITGKVSYFTRVYDPTFIHLQQLYSLNFLNPEREFHSKSFFMGLIAQSEDKVVKKDGRLHLESNLQSSDNSSSQYSNSLQSLEHIPQILWLFQGSEIDPSDFFTGLILDNINRYAQQSSFDVRLVTDQNYKTWISPDSEMHRKLTQFLSLLDNKLVSQKSNFKDHYQRIKGEIILLTLLYEFGGVYLTKAIVMHENFNWIKNLSAMEFVNKGGNSTAQVFGIFSPGYSSPLHNKFGDHYVESPSLQNFFLASAKRTLFIKDFIGEYMKVIEEYSMTKQRLQSIKYNFDWLHGEDPYYECFFLASQFTLYKRKEQLRLEGSSLSVTEFYGLYAINTYYYPYRLHQYFSSSNATKSAIIKSLGGTHLSELEEQIGKLRYFSIISKSKELDTYLKNAIAGEKGSEVVEQSFLHKFLMPKESLGVIKKQMIYSKANISAVQSWENLPKLAWVYVPNGLKSSPLGVQALFVGMKNAATHAGFELKEVNDSNIENLLDKFNFKKLSKLINANEDHKSLLYRLAILEKYGGVSFVPETIITEDLGWIRGISSLDKIMMFNRYGELPKMLMMVDSLHSPANQWTYNPECGCKTGHNIGWSDSFIAAQKDNQLIKEWYEELTTYMELDPQELDEVFEECKIKDIEWSATDPKRLGSDALLCVLNRKHKELVGSGGNTEVCDYYRLWGISESFGMNKMSDALNLDQTVADPNPFIWMWQRQTVEKIIGGIRPMVKLSRKQVFKLEEVIETYTVKPWGQSNSLLVKGLYEPLKDKIKMDAHRLFITSY